VEGFLADTAAELDGYLAARDYQVPVPASATAAFELVTRYNAIGANALAQAAAPDSPHADKAQKDWERILKALREGNVELPGAPRDTGVTAVRVRSATDQPPFFTRTMRL
jgi:phage gp36-like protein